MQSRRRSSSTGRGPGFRSFHLGSCRPEAHHPQPDQITLADVDISSVVRNVPSRSSSWAVPSPSWNPRASRPHESCAPPPQTWPIFQTVPYNESRMPCFSCREEQTHNRGHVGKLHVAGHRDRLNKKLVLAFRIGSRLLLQGLKQDYDRPVSSIP